MFSLFNRTNNLRCNISNLVVKALENNETPWQKPWQGTGKGVGFPMDARTKKKFFGINFLLLQMAAKEHGFVSSWWGTSDQFAMLGSKVKNRPTDIMPGYWGTETVFYDQQFGKTNTIPSVVYNADQLEVKLKNYLPDFNINPSYDLAEKVLHATNAKIKFNDEGEAWYFYPPKDYILLPKKRIFEDGWGGLPGYYESLAHELIHWSEVRMGFDVDCDEGIRELRADIGAAMLMEELHVPHSISFSNYNKWQDHWIHMLKKDYNLIFLICASASHAVEFIKRFSMKPETRFNQISESAA